MIQLTQGLKSASKLSLPVIYEERGLRGGLWIAVFGGIFGGLPLLLYLLNAFAERPSLLLLLLFSGFGFGICWLGLTVFLNRQSLVISDASVAWSHSGLKGSEGWEEPRSAFAGVLGIESETMDSRTGAVEKEYKILLKHALDPLRTIELSRSCAATFSADIDGYAAALKFPSLGLAREPLPQPGNTRLLIRASGALGALCAIVVLVAVNHAFWVEYGSGHTIAEFEIRRDHGPIPATVGQARLSPEMNPLRAVISYTTIQRPLIVDYTLGVRLKDRAVKEFRGNFPVGSEEYNQRFALGEFSLDEPGEYCFDFHASGRDLDQLSSMQLSLRANTTRYSRKLLWTCGVVAALALLLWLSFKIGFYRRCKA